MTTRLQRHRPLMLVALLLVGLAGCFGSSDGPLRYELTGTAEFNGEPIPYGRILLMPDTESGNSGPAAVADIEDGTYETRPDSGHTGGRFRVRIIATDGTQPSSPDIDNSLFPPYYTTIELPAEDCEHAFSIGETAVP